MSDTLESGTYFKLHQTLSLTWIVLWALLNFLRTSCTDECMLKPLITPDLQKRLASELFPGERVLYAAVPVWRAEIGKLAVIFFGSLCWSIVAISLLCASVCSLLGHAPVTFNGQPAGTAASALCALFTLPFVGLGLLGMATPFLSIRKSNNTVHAITGQRLLNVYTGPDHGVESFKLEQINFVVRRDLADGTGTLQIGYGVTRDADGDPRPLTTEWCGVPEARRAEALIHEHAKWTRHDSRDFSAVDG